jgi:hypothetical protein
MLICPLCDEVTDLSAQAIDDEVVTDLAAALRRRDFVEAEAQLDKLAADNGRLSWAVSLGRFGGRAKAA